LTILSSLASLTALLSDRKQEIEIMPHQSARRSRGGRPRLLTIKIAVCLAFAGLSLLGERAADARAQDNAAQEFFEKRVRPLLVANCQSCHNPSAKMAELDLTTAEGFARGGASGAIIDRAKLESSRILKVISYNENLKMPPTGKLKDDEIAVLTEWVRMGAPWPGTGEVIVEKAVRPVRELTEKEKSFWAFQPLGRYQLPTVKNRAWVSSQVDRFVLAKLEQDGLVPAPEADRLTLVRRATFDLTGLPPTPQEIRDFLADKSPKAFEKLVDRLLASPRYGEQWGRHWLDVARYADSTGNDEDHRYPHAWRYRDWVIESFNRDLPYDRFIQEQLAGDLLPPSDEDAATGINRRGIVATGFLALGAKALAQQDKTKMLYDVYDEQVDVTTRAFLGLTVACARCHDHKFDPILARDYYSMVSIFASTRSFKDPKAFVSEPLNKPLVPKPVVDAYLAAKRLHDDRVKLNRYEIETILDEMRAPLVRQTVANLGAIMRSARRVYADSADLATEARKADVSPEYLKRWVEYLNPTTPREHLLPWQNAPREDLVTVSLDYQQRFVKRVSEWDSRIAVWRKKYTDARAANKSPLPDKPGFEAGSDRFFAQVYFGKEGPLALRDEDEAQFPPEIKAQLKLLRVKRDELKKQAPLEPDAACAVEDGEVVNQKIFVRGDYHNPGDDVTKAFPQVLVGQTKQPEIRGGSGRLQLAQWLTQAENPLTSRVMVNRVWAWHMGEGLVRTTDNFGRMGERPSHPELLDYLARQFVATGWSIKALHREIMLSSTYRMKSDASPQVLAKDPENRLFSRFNRRRLSVEEMRDSLLAVDGSLDLKMGGTLQTGTGTDGENDNKRLSLNPEKLNRRTVYLPLRRANLPALLNLFDFGDATTVNGHRQLTNVSTQALFWLNSDFLAERSSNLAKIFLSPTEGTQALRVRRAYLLILGREPSAEEATNAAKYLAGYRAKFSEKRKEADVWASFARILLSTNDFNYID
jgi:mono/diheme cytochrome c family protein